MVLRRTFSIFQTLPEFVLERKFNELYRERSNKRLVVDIEVKFFGGFSA